MGRIEERETGEKFGYIGMLAVDKQYRRRGIGRRLMTSVIAAFTHEDIKEIRLETETTNTASQGLYQSLGFHITDTLPSHYSDGTDAYRLVLPNER